jgi:hypothetical protein
MNTYRIALTQGPFQSGRSLSLAPLSDSIIHDCVHSSYQTNAGIVSGIQWIPAEATSVVPAGAQPANPVCRYNPLPSYL